jgi:hypothetical protein
MGVKVGKVYLFEAKRAAPEGAINKMRRSELVLSRIQDAVDHLALLPLRIGMSAGDWNVHSTRAQFALGRALAEMEATGPLICEAADAHARFGREWGEISANVRKEGRTVAALASALCSNGMPSADRYQAQDTIATEVSQLIEELARAQVLFKRCA